MFPIYVLSKGRIGTAITCTMLDQEQLPYVIISTPEEQAGYQRAYRGKVLPLQQEGWTIGCVRNAVLADARQKKLSWIWMLDDDIQKIRVMRNGQVETPPLSCLGALEEQMIQLPVAQAGMTGSLPSAKRVHLSWNGYCCNVVAFCMERMAGYSYDERLFFGEDVDLTLQLLTNGELNVRFLAYSFVCYSYGKMGKRYAGGLEQTYQTQNVAASLEIIARKYGPSIVTVGKDGAGRAMLVVKWQQFRKGVPQ